MHDDVTKIDHLVEPENPLEEATLEGLTTPMRESLKRAGWSQLMPVQRKAIPYVLARRDLMIQSRTGSGKTAAFLLPMFGRIKPSSRGCQALVLVPTRELAKQVHDEAVTLAGDSGIRSVAVYGGVGYGPQLDAFRAGAQIVIGTPGRILDHLIKGSLRLDDLEAIVFDEADRMLSMGFYPDMKRVQEFLPEPRINGYMFSATFPPRVKSLARQFLREPEFLSLSSDNLLVEETRHRFMVVPPMDKDGALVRLIEIENPESALIFCNTRSKVHYVSTVLQRFGYEAEELSSDISQKERENAMLRLRTAKLRFLVATDIAERGIDVQDLSHVLQYEVPQDADTYVHRSGRTGRAGASGEVIALITPIEKMELRRVARRLELEIRERDLPSQEQVVRTVTERATTLLEARLRDLGEDEREQLDAYLPQLEELAGSESGLRLLAMLVDEFYHGHTHGRGQLPAPARAAREGALAERLSAHHDSLDNLIKERLVRFTDPVRDWLERDETRPLVLQLLPLFEQRCEQTPAPAPPRSSGSSSGSSDSGRGQGGNGNGGRGRSSGRRRRR